MMEIKTADLWNQLSDESFRHSLWNSSSRYCFSWCSKTRWIGFSAIVITEDLFIKKGSWGSFFISNTDTGFRTTQMVLVCKLGCLRKSGKNVLSLFIWMFWSHSLLVWNGETLNVFLIIYVSTSERGITQTSELYQTSRYLQGALWFPARG